MEDVEAWLSNRDSSQSHVVFDTEAFDLKSRNVVIVGDVHGCFDELQELHSQFIEPNDLVILAGDLVNKGPKSVEVIEYARKNEFFAILGNHEIASLRHHFKRINPKVETEIWTERGYEWNKCIQQDNVDFLLSLPFTISIPYHNAIVVHAGLIPNLPLEKQSIAAMVGMRNLVKMDSGYEAKSKPAEGGVAWAKVWEGPKHVYFGHDAYRKIQKEKYATGLDSGCVYGNHLSAVILEPGGSSRIVQVQALKRYAGTSTRSKLCGNISSTLSIAFVVGLASAVLWMVNSTGSKSSER